MLVTKVIRARNAKELGIALRLMYADNIATSIKVTETSHGKIVYDISATSDERDISTLERRYRILIS